MQRESITKATCRTTAAMATWHDQNIGRRRKNPSLD